MSPLKPAVILSLVFLIGLSIGWLSSADATIIHEDPARLAVQQPSDINSKIVHQLWQMFDSLGAVVSHINASDFDASRLSMNDYEQYYQSFKNYLSLSGISESDARDIIGQADLADAEFRAMINDSECFDSNMTRFEEYQAEGDTLNATLTSVELQKYWDGMNNSSRHLSDSVSLISQMMQNLSVDSTHLAEPVNMLDGYMGRMSELNTLPLSLPGNSDLSLDVNQPNVSTGDNVEFTSQLVSNGTAVRGGLVTLYVDGKPAGNGTTSSDGSTVLDYEVKGGSFASIMNAVAHFDPGETNFTPAVSNNVTLYRQTIPTDLSIRITPDNAVFGDTVLVQGRLTADGGYPVPDHLISVNFPGCPAYNVTTQADGTYSCDVNITQDFRAGDLDVNSSYGAATSTGEALSSVTSMGVRLHVLQSGTAMTLDPPPASIPGGENITFSGTLTGNSRRPVNGKGIEIFADDVLIGQNVPLDETGRYNVTLAIPVSLSPGRHDIYAVYAPEAGMSLTGSQSNRYIVDVRPAEPEITVTGMPLIAFQGDRVNLLTCTVIVAVVLLVIGLVLALATRVKRALSRANRSRQKPLPESQEAPVSQPSLILFEDEIARIEAIVTKVTDRREVISEIYRASRRIAGTHGFAVHDSATHREFFRSLTVKEPSLITPAGTITRNYESAVYGHVSPDEQDLVNSLNSLREIDGRMSDTKTGGGA